jgi:hypothetical protein
MKVRRNPTRPRTTPSRRSKTPSSDRVRPAAEPESQPQPGPDRGLSAAEHGSDTPPKGEALIRGALATRRRQSKVLANLSAEERRRLRLLATKLLMGNDPGETH